jgi:hypothetical protein
MGCVRRHLAMATGMAALLTLTSLGTAGCGGSKFRPNVLISTDDYAISDFACTSRVGEAIVDGEVVDEVQWIGRGTITNLLATESPSYDLRFSATFDDGSRTDDDKAMVIGPLAPGASTEFSFVVTPVGPTPTECAVFLYDSVLNHRG